jgi:hypothetical protein
MLMLSPYSRKAVDVPDGLVDRFREAGFKEQESEAVAPAKADAAPRAKRTPRKPRTAE